MNGWGVVLAEFLSAVRPRVAGVEWMLVGSAASAVHGVDVSPVDVDVLVHPDTSDAALREVAERLARFVADSSPGSDLEVALSTRDRGLYESDGTWMFGRWLIGGTKLEIARIRDLAVGDLLLETLRASVWSVRQQVFRGGVATRPRSQRRHVTDRHSDPVRPGR